MSFRAAAITTLCGFLILGWPAQADPPAPAKDDSTKEFNPGGRAYWKYRVSGKRITDLSWEAVAINKPSSESPRRIVEAYLALWYPSEPEATLAYDRALSEVNTMWLSEQKLVLDEFLTPDLAQTFGDHDQKHHADYVKKLASKKVPFSFEGDWYSASDRVSSVEIVSEDEVWVYAESLFVRATTGTFDVRRTRFLCKKNDDDEWHIFGAQSWDNVDNYMEVGKEQFDDYLADVRQWRDSPYCVAAIWATLLEYNDLPEPDCSTAEKAVETLWSVARFRLLGAETSAWKHFSDSRFECCREFFDADHLASQVKAAKIVAEADRAKERMKVEPDSIRKLNEDTVVVQFAVHNDSRLTWILNKVDRKWVLGQAGRQDVDKKTGETLDGDAHFKPCKNFTEAFTQ